MADLGSPAVGYEVATPSFTGPFDLLLHLILSEEVELYEINLASIIDGYLAEVERMQGLDLEMATEFLLIAATLIELKTRRLLPTGDDLDLDDELALWEERDLLLARLLECKTFKDASTVLRQLSAEADLVWGRTVGPDERFAGLAPDLLATVEAIDLRDAFIRATAPRPVPRVDLSHLAPIKVSVGDAVNELVSELPGSGRLSFRHLTSGLVDRIEVVVRFLAVLELFKQGFVELHQVKNFGDIEVEWTGERGLDDLTNIDGYDG